MRSLLTIAALLSFSVLGSNAQAQSCACNGQTKLSQSQVSAAIGGKTVCVGSAGNWQHQEFHAGTTGGALTDYKRGPGHPIDPSENLGSWSLSNNGTVTYTYNGGGGTHAFGVCTINATTYGMCPGVSNQSTIVFTTRAGQTGC